MAEALSESVFDDIAALTLDQMVTALSDLEDERLDADLESGVLTLRFDDGTRYVVNSHRAARQIWMAAEATAWHFEWNGQAWISTKSDDELWNTVRTWVSKKLGHEIDLPRPAP